MPRKLSILQWVRMCFMLKRSNIFIWHSQMHLLQIGHSVQFQFTFMCEPRHSLSDQSLNCPQSDFRWSFWKLMGFRLWQNAGIAPLGSRLSFRYTLLWWCFLHKMFGFVALFQFIVQVMSKMPRRNRIRFEGSWVFNRRRQYNSAGTQHLEDGGRHIHMIMDNLININR